MPECITQHFALICNKSHALMYIHIKCASKITSFFLHRYRKRESAAHTWWLHAYVKQQHTLLTAYEHDPQSILIQFSKSIRAWQRWQSRNIVVAWTIIIVIFVLSTFVPFSVTLNCYFLTCSDVAANVPSVLLDKRENFISYLPVSKNNWTKEK